MGEKSKLELEEELPEKQSEVKKPSVLQIVCDTLLLAVTTLMLIGVYVVSFISSDSIFGFQNSTGELSDEYYSQVCAAIS